MTDSILLVVVQNSIERLNLSAFHPRAFPINERRSSYISIRRAIGDLYDRSVIDEYMRDDLSDRALTAYVHGGL